MPAAAVETLAADHRAELNRALRDPLPVASDPQPTTITPGAAPPAGATGVGGPPPRTGPGSGRDAWAAYAAQQGLTVPASAGRDDIIHLTEEAQRGR
jgi:hypothetical protein